MKSQFDLLIIGGGVNGAGIARDAAGRGMSVLLVEANDLASATSSASTKLVHGGLRYLEYFQFRLVRESLKERETLLGLAPHIIRPMDFVLPHGAGVRPAFIVQIGLWLYDRLGRRDRLKGSGRINLRNHQFGWCLQEKYKAGFTYADCWVDDARLVVLNALDASELGAGIMTYTTCTGLRVVDGLWEAELMDSASGGFQTVRASMVVNAAGPWVHSILDGNGLVRKGKTPKIRLVKGSHIIVPKIFDRSQAYILQQPDRRIVFAIPYEEQYTLIGTTDVDYVGDPGRPEIDDAEKKYLCDAVNRYFKTAITEKDIVHTYSGVRPLIDDGKGNASAVTRDYHLDLETSFGPPIVSVFGGKITTYRKLAESVMDIIVPHWSRRDDHPGATLRWTDTVPLAGGDMLDGDFDAFLKDQKKKYGWLPESLLLRYARAYGTRMDRFLAGATGIESLGAHFGCGVYQAEIDYLTHREFARTVDDVLWRRTKLGLHIDQETVKNIDSYINRGKIKTTN